jgi:transketolase
MSEHPTPSPPRASTEDRVEDVRRRAAFIRRETVRLIEVAKTGHYTSVYSCAEILAALYSGVMRLADDPDWPERDRLVLSKGHVAVGVYPLLAERGYIDRSVLDEYTRLGNPLGDHPDMRKVAGIDFSSGSLGHGLSVGVGMAQAARMKGFLDPRIFVLLGDQELNEGQVWEAAQSAAHFGLGNLVAIVDRNQMGLDGITDEVMGVEPIDGRFQAFGWDVVHVDGHDVPALLDVLDGLADRREARRPVCVVARTIKGKGVDYMELSRTWHLGYLAPSDADDTLKELDARA